MKVSEYFGLNTFDYESMKEKLPKDVYKELIETISKGKMLNIDVANTVAHAMKEWALEYDVTHFTHWFQPLTRGSAEKHDAFLSISDDSMIERLSGSQLVQAEPDASSFPSGGMRSTFEARGYSAWDPTSPAFIIEHSNGKTLCIPSIYLSYTGDALDRKTPLLRSIDLLNKKVIELLDLINIKTERIYPTIGPEQEFFLIPRELYMQRPDLRLTGRTLLGKASPKGQKLSDHYFGAIPEKVLEFFSELEFEAYKLGIPLKTRHNEVAPSQFEFAPIYEESNVANDHNQLLMELMKKIARRKDFALLLNEKPFANVNGSGKHNNWSMQTYEGRNLLDPGQTIEDHYQFLLILSIILHAVNKHERIIRSSIATPGNDYRLGANEAPPAIISVFIGSALQNFYDELSSGHEITMDTINEIIDTGLAQLPNIRKHNTDRNRTSPFAFTGNKFEFRAVGSSQTLGFPNTVLNLIVSDSTEYAISLLNKYKNKCEDKCAILETIKQLYSESSRIIFNGDNYNADWVVEAEKRKLSNIKNSYEAIRVLIEQETIDLFSKHKVLSERELKARYNVQIENYRNQILIESDVITDMIKASIIPALLRYYSELDKEFIKDLPEFENLGDNIREIIILTNKQKEMTEQLRSEDINSGSKGITYDLIPHMHRLRELVDSLESITPKNSWPFPSYIDLLHSL